VEGDDDLSVGDDLVEEIHHHVPEAEAREGAERRGDDRVERPLEGERRQQIPAEEPDRAGNPKLRLPFLGEHDEDVHDQKDAREDAERAHDEEQVRRVPADLHGLRDRVRLHGVDLQAHEMVLRNAQPQVVCHLLGRRDALRDPADVRDANQIDRPALVERGLGAAQIHEEDGPAPVRRLADVAYDRGHAHVDDRLVRRPIEQGQVFARRRVQVRGCAFVREDLDGPEHVRVGRSTVEPRQRAERSLSRGVQSQHGDLLVPLVPRDVPDRHDLQEDGRDPVDRAADRREVRGDLRRVRFGEGE